MKSVFKTAVLAAAAAVTAFLLLAPTRGFGQEQLDEKSKQNKAKQIARAIADNARELTILDRDGKVVKALGPAGLYNQPVFSPDGTRVAAVKADLEAENNDLWVFDIASGATTRLTTSQSREEARAPVWSPDGTEIAYVGLRGGSEGLYRKSSSG
jgi:hypothetical protein